MGEAAVEIREAFKKPASQRSSAEKTYAKNTTERRVASASLRSCFQSKKFLLLFSSLVWCCGHHIEVGHRIHAPRQRHAVLTEPENNGVSLQLCQSSATIIFIFINT